MLPLWTRNEVTGPAVWRYLSSRWDEAHGAVPGQRTHAHAGGVYDLHQRSFLADEVEAFHRAHPVAGGYPMNMDQQFECMRVGLAFAAAMRQQF